MADTAHGGSHRSKWRLTPAGSILLTVFVVLLVLAFVAPSTPVYAGLALVILAWAAALNSGFPTQSSGRSPRAARDFDEQLRASDRRRRRSL